MNRYKALSIVLGFATVLGIYAGYWIGASKAQVVFDTMNFLLTSERNTEAIQNIKALNGLREKQIDATLQFMEVRVKGALGYKGIKPDAITLAKDYQRKYCKTGCLGVDNEAR
ncbi:hypothetical protein SVA_0788 [Sulfurifustis variabilis]|uniref:Uncharacterized protein n=1 Tax=Sulfurifustis variabilis TaxID=1675686 RepID=A0A1B4VD50_9GAMM|nr:hypothetical protein [Sulfurifustis variabilis]BAU47367.1 hypothetical protein SVA_0788 [Sulfurifustis variabilis]